ncbi:MAG: hypothetical protein H7062_19380 [Candidatus Saccharimonas sp.]|nr:hypothetical protein [Planctomycetaceae bacterium]
MQFTVFRCVAALAVLLVFTAAPSLAQDKPAKVKRIDIEQASFQPTIQTGRPIPTWWDVKVSGTALVEGRFEFAMRNDGRLLASFSTEEMALAPPQQSIRIMLPPVDDLTGIEQLQLDVTFRGKRFTEVLAPQVLRVAMSGSRTFMVLTSNSRLAAKRSAERDRVRKRLAFESMLTSDYENAVLTIYSPLEPDKLPAEPMAYCAYDLAVLFGDEFRALKKPQLDALVAWVRAGGSLYVEPTGVLEPFHIEFLRGLTVADPRGLLFQPDSSGKLIPGTVWEDERIVTTTTGLGRVAVRVEEELDADDEVTTNFESEAWRRAVASLWRLRSEQIEAVAKNGQFDAEIVVSKFGGQMIDTNGDGVPDTPQSGIGFVFRGVNGQSQVRLPQGWLSWNLSTSTGELLDRLMPEGVRMVPLWLLGFILLGFVVLIGPVDYIGLGWLKARKYTWITFPLATVAVTALTVWVSNSFMSSAEARRGLVLRDVGDDGTVVRTNRFELLFIASSRSVTTDVQKGVFKTLGTGGQMANNSAVFQQQQMLLMQQQRSGRPNRAMSGELMGDKSPPRIAGRIPAQFQVTQDLAKWTPQLNRMFWITGPTDEQPIDWSAIADGQITPALLGNRAVSAKLQERVRKQFGDKAMVACLGPNGAWTFDSQRSWWTNVDEGANPYYRNRQLQLNQWGDPTGIALPPEIQQQGALFRWVYQHSVALPRGLFALASQVGPKGGAELDDLPVYDPSDPNHALLIVVVPKGDDLIVYRKRVAIAK